MERIGTLRNKTRTRVFDEGNFRGYTEYLIESEAGTRPAPQGFLVHQQPGWELPVHYHLEEQFQVVVRGSGTLGKHPLGPITIHYSTREAGYGPIVAGPDGLDYFTLRAVTDPGAWYLPESRDRMRKGLRKRHVTVGPAPGMTEVALRDLVSPRCETLIAPDAQGLAAWLLRLPPHGRTTAPGQEASGGRFHVVVGGSLLATGVVVDPLGLVWRGPEEGPLQAEAGPDGVEVLVLQFPASALDPEPVPLA